MRHAPNSVIKLAGQRRGVDQAVGVGHLDAVDPDAVHADRVGGQARRAAGQVEDAALGAAADAGRVEQQQVGGVALAQQAALGHAEQRRALVRQAAHRLGQAHRAALAHPVAEQVQAEAGVVEEGQVRAGVAERDDAVRVVQHAAHGLFVAVEQLRGEDGAQVLGERQVEHRRRAGRGPASAASSAMLRCSSSR